MITTNPYLQEKHDLMRQHNSNPSPETAQKIAELEAKSRTFVQALIQELDSQVEYVREQVASVSKDYQSKRQQYLRLIQLYREAMKLAKEISQVKKEMRMER